MKQRKREQWREAKREGGKLGRKQEGKKNKREEEGVRECVMTEEGWSEGIRRWERESRKGIAGRKRKGRIKEREKRCDGSRRKERKEGRKKKKGGRESDYHEVTFWKPTDEIISEEEV